MITMESPQSIDGRVVAVRTDESGHVAEVLRINSLEKQKLSGEQGIDSYTTTVSLGEPVHGHELLSRSLGMEIVQGRCGVIDGTYNDVSPQNPYGDLVVVRQIGYVPLSPAEIRRISQSG